MGLSTLLYYVVSFWRIYLLNCSISRQDKVIEYALLRTIITMLNLILEDKLPKQI